MLYPDPRRDRRDARSRRLPGRPLAEVTDEYGAIHRIWKIPAPAAMSSS